MVFGTSKIMNIIEKQKQKITPLYIIVTFVALSEGLFAYTIPQTTSYLQITLTFFAIVFVFGVAIAFFTILWFRPYVFYPPSEYPNANPKPYIQAMDESLSPEKVEQLKLVSEVQQHPKDEDTEHALFYSLLPSYLTQLIILMYENGVSLPNGKESECNCHYGEIGKQYIYHMFKIRWTISSLKYTKYLKKILDNKVSKIVLTKRGKRFAKWMVRNGKKREYFICEYGNWGNIPPDILEAAKDDKREKELK